MAVNTLSPINKKIGMECERNFFTITWRIENYDFCYELPGNVFSSSPFVINSAKNYSYVLQIIYKSELRNEDIAFFIRNVDTEEIYNKFDFEVSFFNDNNSSPLFEKFVKSSITYSGESSNIFRYYVPRSQIYIRNGNEFKPPKTLTIRCRLYKTDEHFSETWQCFIRTRIQVEKTAFIGSIKKFRSVPPHEKRTLRIKSASAENQLFALYLSLADDASCSEKVWIEVTSLSKDYGKFCVCKIFILDSEGIKTECGRSEILLNKLQSKKWKIPLNLTKNHLLKGKTRYLPNDTLTLKCEFAFSTGIECNRMEDSEYSNLTFVAETRPKAPSALEDLFCLYKEGILCDTKLQTATETFKAHKFILSARSEVFKTMFTTEMKEKTNDCVIIEDLDADTVRQMLRFLYSDKLEDLNREQAESLYFAADKYNIIGLKHRCSDYLKNSLQLSNCCEILLLSDRHQDEDLKKFVLSYIADYRDEIFCSDKWANFEKRNPELSFETFHFVYLGK